MHQISSRPRQVSDADTALHTSATRQRYDLPPLDTVHISTAATSATDPKFYDNEESKYIVSQSLFGLCASRSEFEMETSCRGADANHLHSAVYGGKRKRPLKYMMQASSSVSMSNLSLQTTVDVAGNTPIILHTPVLPPDNKSMQSLPDEAVVHIASYLSPFQIRNLALINSSTRKILIHSRGAVETIWMEYLRGGFPDIFRSDIGGKVLTSADVTFVNFSNDSSQQSMEEDSFMDTDSLNHLNISSNNNDVVGSTQLQVSLAWLTSLLPKRYPKQIDCLSMVGERNPFRTFYLDLNSDDRTNWFSGNKSTTVKVVQFTGTVGTGDRCIRSDLPFPNVIADAISSSRCYPWRQSKINRSKCKRQHGPFTPVSPVSPPSAAAATQSNSSIRSPTSQSPHSPLLQFLSSLSHHKHIVSMYNENNIIANYTELESDDEDAIGINNYGIFSFGKCKERLGKLANRSGNDLVDNLRPFVVPIVLSQEQQKSNLHRASFQSKCNNKCVVDLTPRLCCYFEVTILKHLDSSSKQNHDDEATANLQNTLDVHQNVERPAPRSEPLHHHPFLNRQLHRWRIPHRRLPMHPLVGLATFDDVSMPHFPFQRAMNDHGLPVRPPPRANRTGALHECVAVGLSTLAFNPRDKMPGWDNNSYGYHGDDGGIFHGHGDMIRRFGPSFGLGDIVGCGLEYTTKRIFFVKNGEFLGYAFDALEDDVIERGVYPTVGVDTECPLFINFGATPFCFDLSKVDRDGYHLEENEG